jgi:hypothetical protein
VAGRGLGVLQQRDVGALSTRDDYLDAAFEINAKMRIKLSNLTNDLSNVQ